MAQVIEQGTITGTLISRTIKMISRKLSARIDWALLKKNQRIDRGTIVCSRLSHQIPSNRPFTRRMSPMMTKQDRTLGVWTKPWTTEITNKSRLWLTSWALWIRLGMPKSEVSIKALICGTLNSNNRLLDFQMSTQHNNKSYSRTNSTTPMQLIRISNRRHSSWSPRLRCKTKKVTRIKYWSQLSSTQICAKSQQSNKTIKPPARAISRIRDTGAPRMAAGLRPKTLPSWLIKVDNNTKEGNNMLRRSRGREGGARRRRRRWAMNGIRASRWGGRMGAGRATRMWSI